MLEALRGVGEPAKETARTGPPTITGIGIFQSFVSVENNRNVQAGDLHERDERETVGERRWRSEEWTGRVVLASASGP